MKMPAVIIALLALLAGAAALPFFAAPPSGAQTATDYDTDNDGLIEVRSLAQLNAMRWDLDGDGNPDSATNTADYLLAFPDRDTATSTRMGCPSGNCRGYELRASLAFPADGPFADWIPIGAHFNPFNTVFDGNGRTLTGLTVNAGSGDAGLFGVLGGRGVIRDVGLINVNVRTTGSSQDAGGLVGEIRSGGRIDTSYVRGGSVTVALDSSSGGGLVGLNWGSIRASYATATVSAGPGPGITTIGGLVGYNNDGTIIASYAAGAVPSSGTTTVDGGFVGYSVNIGPVITDSYCDISVSVAEWCLGAEAHDGDPVTVPGKTTAQLQNPTGYKGIYRRWNLDLDGDSAPDYPWNFGASDQYPTLHTPGQRVRAARAAARPREPEPEPYDPAAAHPEVYANPRYGMSASCEVADGADAAVIRFDLGNYQREVYLILSLWNGEFFMSYEALDIPLPPLVRDGQSASVRVTTDPAQTRFRLDSGSPATNLVMGYADCHTDDDGGP